MKLFILSQKITDDLQKILITPSEIAFIMGHNDVFQLLISQAFRAIRADMASLDLSHKLLGLQTGTELAKVFKTIPANITLLDLSNNYFKDSELVAVLHAIPLNVNSVRIDDKIINIPNFKKIDNEIGRLIPSMSKERSFLVSLGIIEASDSKINALKQLRSILINGTLVDKKPEEFHNRLCDWKATYGECIAKQRNRIHSFFSPNHILTAAIAVDEVFAALNIFDKAKTTTQII